MISIKCDKCNVNIRLGVGVVMSVKVNQSNVLYVTKL